jgi:hypothetical protein
MCTLKYYAFNSLALPCEACLRKAKARMLRLRKLQMISQCYTIVVPYLCQIHHLLNLKHLEALHSLSLKGLKINGDRQITVIFNVLPLGDRVHKLCIDMYSNLAFPKPILKLLLHCASCITVLEDLHYLYWLAKSHLERSLRTGNSHQTM